MTEMRACAICGEPLPKQKQLYCSWECAKAANKARQKKRKESIPKPSRTKICAICGQNFEAKTKNQRYCSVRCSRKAYQGKYYEKNEQYFMKKNRVKIAKDMKERNAKLRDERARIAAEASAAGMSYGQYVARRGG